jgi:glutamate synthase (NADPH/NADH) small chain
VETVQPYQTANEKVFVAGDMRRGASLVATAISEGRACAKAVDKYLEGYTNM